METLKFTPKLIPLVLNGSKTVTWRLFDDKNLQENDKLSLINSESEERFAQAKIVKVKETTFKELTDDNKNGHEKFSCDEEMYRTYSQYYKCEINKNTPLKVIRFELLDTSEI